MIRPLPYLTWLLLASTCTASVNSGIPPSSTPLTCPFRTVNYITHSLAQRCLATTRPANSTAATGQGVPSVHNDSDPITSLKEKEDDNRTPPPNQSTTSDAPSDHTPAASSTKTSSAAISSASVEISIVRDLGPVSTALEDESELEGGNFLSFEEWKRQNLKKVGQSEHVGQRRQDVPEQRNRATNVQNSLDSLGDDAEIELDFSGFGPGGLDKGVGQASIPIADVNAEGADRDVGDLPRPNSRNKDAGTTCKERFNYASFDCAANMLKWNKEAKSPTSVLIENKDSYMLNRCSADDKFIILELCNDILIDTVVLANFEFFSSTFRTFRVSISDRWPLKADKWKTLGTYEARNSRDVQAFLVENPLIWARYLRIDFLTHYGSEYYCPLSLVRVHGTTMMEDYKHEMQLALEEESDEVENGVDTLAAIDSLTPEAVADAVAMSTTVEHSTPSATASNDASQEPTTSTGHKLDSQVSEPTSIVVPASVIAMEAIASVIESPDVCSPSESPTEVQTSGTHASQVQSVSTKEPSPALSAATPQSTSGTDMHNTTVETSSAHTTTASPDLRKNVTNYLSASADMQEWKPTISEGGRVNTTSDIDSKASTSLSTSTSTSTSAGNTDSTSSTSSSVKSRIQVPASSGDRSKSSSATAQSHPPTPTTQESFFKTVQKRLQMLEANSSLSLQYIEDQSRALRDAFKKVEQKQLARTGLFLDALNQTVLNELREFRQQYDQLWQSTVIELEVQRERYERDNEAINARIGILADEVIFQRRMAIMQMLLILICLVLVLFSKGAINNYLELPIVQNVLRSPSSKWLNLSTDSLLRPAKPTRTRSAHQLRTERTGILKAHRRMHSEDSITDNPGISDIYSPPTPISDYGQADVGMSREEPRSPVIDSEIEENKYEDPSFDPDTLERPATSPPMLTVTEESPVLDADDSVGDESIGDHAGFN